MRAADDAETRCEYFLRVWRNDPYLRHHLIRVLSSQRYRAHKIPDKSLRYYYERNKILASGSIFSTFDLQLCHVIRSAFAQQAFTRGPSSKKIPPIFREYTCINSYCRTFFLVHKLTRGKRGKRDLATFDERKSTSSGNAEPYAR